MALTAVFVQICLSWHRNSQQESAWFPGASLSGIDRHSQLLSTCVFHLCKLGNDRRRFALMSQLHPLSRKNNLWIGPRNPSIQLNVKSLFVISRCCCFYCACCFLSAALFSHFWTVPIFPSNNLFAFDRVIPRLEPGKPCAQALASEGTVLITERVDC